MGRRPAAVESSSAGLSGPGPGAAARFVATPPWPGVRSPPWGAPNPLVGLATRGPRWAVGRPGVTDAGWGRSRSVSRLRAARCHHQHAAVPRCTSDVPRSWCRDEPRDVTQEDPECFRFRYINELDLQRLGGKLLGVSGSVRVYELGVAKSRPFVQDRTERNLIGDDRDAPVSKGHLQTVPGVDRSPRDNPTSSPESALLAYRSHTRIMSQTGTCCLSCSCRSPSGGC